MAPNRPWNEDEPLTGSPQVDRRLMVEELRARGIRDARVLRAMLKVPRHRFISEAYWDQAYANRPLPIDEGQTISQPYIVALMIEALELQPTDRVLEIGTGSGYQTALLAELAAEVYTVERLPKLIEQARERLESMGYRNVHYKLGDGTLGWPEFAPYGTIIASGAVPKVPPSLRGQMTDGGRMILPVGGRHIQRLLLIRREGERFDERELGDCSFVPLIGEEGWPEGEAPPTTHLEP
jgi:protein-L-isoaspartate(D-aspartate) O-methyltransferase